MNIVTGCSGIDAIAYAAQLLDIDVTGQIEIDEFCNKILELRFPGVSRYKNIFDVRGDEFGPVDIFGFGDPCQPHSVAGKQKGTSDDRYIWPEIFRIIKTMRPTWIINENVTGSVSNGVVLSKINDLESAGYWARSFIVPACGVGAMHQRYRVIIVGYSVGIPICKVGEIQRGTYSELAGNGEVVGNTKCVRFSGESRGRTGKKSENGYSGIETMADTTRERLQEWKQPGRWQNAEKTKTGLEPELKRCSEDVAYSSSSRFKELNTPFESTIPGHNTRGNNETGTVGPTQSRMGGNVDGFSNRLHKFTGRQDSSRILETFEGMFKTVLGQIEWPAGYGAEQYEYEPPRVATGVKTRANRLKALGNAIVWQQIFPFLLAIKLIENQNRVSAQ